MEETEKKIPFRADEYDMRLLQILHLERRSPTLKEFADRIGKGTSFVAFRLDRMAKYGFVRKFHGARPYTIANAGVQWLRSWTPKEKPAEAPEEVIDANTSEPADISASNAGEHPDGNKPETGVENSL